jgi:hypothetical protein
MKELGAAEGVPVVDLSALSLALWPRLGVDDTRKCFLFLAAEPSPNYPDGIEDDTHSRAHGGIEVARLIATSLRDRAIPPAADFQRLTSDVADSMIVWP